MRAWHYLLSFEKNDMKNFVRLCLLGSLLSPALGILPTSCDTLNDRSAYHSRGSQNEKRDNSKGDDIPPPVADTTVYALGIEFPQSYDWQKDTAYRNVNSKLVLFANQKRVFEVEAGTGSHLSPEVDKNRLIDGHLYSDFSSEGETIISKDGKELFRYSGEEMMCGIMVTDEHVYTLGQNRQGKGFSYRKDGSLILSQQNGTVLGDMSRSPGESGALYMNGESMLFTYSVRDDGTDKWYLAKDGIGERLSLPSGTVKVLDAKLIGEDLHLAIVTTSSRGRVVHVHNGRQYSLGNDSGGTILNTRYCRIFTTGGTVWLKEEHQLSSGGRRESCLWKGDGTLVQSGQNVFDFWTDDMDYAYIQTNDKGLIERIVTGKKSHSLPDESRFLSSACACYQGGIFYLAATPTNRNYSPFVWKNGKQLALPINGFLIALSVV